MSARHEVSITPEMIEAGRAKWLLWAGSPNPSGEVCLRMIYRAMRVLEPGADLNDDAVTALRVAMLQLQGIAEISERAHENCKDALETICALKT